VARIRPASCLGVTRRSAGGFRARAVRGRARRAPGGATDPVVPGTLYAGTTNGVYRSLDGAGTWAPFGLTGHLVVSLAIAEDGTALYAAEGHPRYAANGALFRTPLP
jgi:hypothetical protein